MKKNRILLITMDYPPPMGGIQRVTFDLHNGLRKGNYDVELLNFDGRNTSNYLHLSARDLWYTPATKNDYFPLRKIANPMNFFGPNGYKQFVYTNLIYRIARRKEREFKPDIIHLLKPNLSAAIYDVICPVIVTCHSEEIENIEPVRYGISRANKVHCVSKFAANLVTKIDARAKQKTIVINNAIDLKKFSQKRPKKNQIITVCRLIARKNVDVTLQAFAELPDRIREEYQFIVVGDGPEKENLEKKAKELQLKNIIFKGNVSEQVKIRLLQESKLFVMCPKPLDGEEGFGISFIEAQAAGMPVIGSQVGGIVDAVGDAGILVKDPLNRYEIASAIEQILSDKRRYAMLKNNAAKRISAFDQAHWIKQIQGVYSELLRK